MDKISLIETLLSAITASVIGIIVTQIVLTRYEKKTRNYKKDKNNLITPQREYIENKMYVNSMSLTQDPGFLEDSNHILFVSKSDKEMTIGTKLPDFSFFEDMGVELQKIKVNEDKVMCLMPFNRKFDKTKNIIAKACEETGYEFQRSDDELIANNTDLRKSIVRMILEAGVVVAVLDGRNPNVYYEIGIAHSMGKLVLMVVNLSRDDKMKSVDLLSNRLITYNNPEELNSKLVKTLNAIRYDERREKKANN